MKRLASTNSAKALIYTSKFKIEGSIKLPSKDSYRSRLSDHLNSSETPVFIAVTDAKVSDLNGKKLYNTECVIINRNHIETVIEQED